MDKQYYENVNKLNSISSLQNHMNDQMSSFANTFNKYCKDYVEFESKCLNQLDEINNRIHKEHKDIANYLEAKEERERDKIRSIVNRINTNTNKMKNRIINRVNANTNFAKNQVINELNQVKDHLSEKMDNNKDDIIFEMGDVLDQINDNIDIARAENLNEFNTTRNEMQNEFNTTRNQMQNEFANSRVHTQIGFDIVYDLIENLKNTSEEAHNVITQKIDINKCMLGFIYTDLQNAENSLYNHIQNIINEINNRMGTINLISNTIRGAAERIDNFIENNVPGLIRNLDSAINSLNLNVYNLKDYQLYVRNHIQLYNSIIKEIGGVKNELNTISKGIGYIDKLAKRITWLEQQMKDQEKYAKDYKSILNQLQALERECSRPHTIIENNRSYYTNINFNAVFNTFKNVSFYLGGLFNREREGNRQIEDENNPVSIEYPPDENERGQPQEPLLLRNGTPQSSQQNTPISTYVRQNVKDNVNTHVSPISTASYYSTNSQQSSPGYSMFNGYNSPNGYNSLSGYNSRPLFSSHDELRQRRPSNNAGEEYYAHY